MYNLGRLTQALECLGKSFRLWQEFARAQTGKPELQRGLAEALRNLIACLDRLAREADERHQGTYAEAYRARLVELRRFQSEQEKKSGRMNERR